MIHVTVGEAVTKPPDTSLPALYSMGSLIVLVTSKTTRGEYVGTVVAPNAMFAIGYHCNSWNADEFTRTKLPVTLRNKD